MAELAAALELSVKDLEELLSHAKGTTSLNQIVGSDNITTLADFIADESPSPDELVEQQELRDKMGQLLIASLSQQQAEIMRLRFGLDNGAELTLKQVGTQLGVSRERVRKVQERAENLLRRQAVSFR